MPEPVNRGIVSALSIIAIGSFYAFWGIVLFIMYSVGWWKVALIPTVILALFAIGIYNKVVTQKGAVPSVRACPDCAEIVQAAARVCKHCGYRFSPTDA
ncbi:hypothetical protein H7J86_24705 [Mycobacterium hackensackense]|uniref:zinc ribbon domain-containing protein n=1 Tax=Mycobacterium hackensackense TaxID=228909 RepID=UPI002265C467|nr:zinc ribbon domain-containing protein [Mycobacterium hackensackense]MCV7255369.1 hypothetical protein [Mycobacterium hackensackense]